jgi:hypothetical protein
VRTRLPDDVTSYGDAARSRLTRLGGADFALRCESDRALRDEVAKALADLGAGDLDVRGDLDQFLAAGQLCRVAGFVALPWPVVEELLAVGGDRLALIDQAMPRVDHGDLAGGWLGSDLEGVTHALSPAPSRAGKLGPFVVPAELGASRRAVPAADVARHLVLGSWRILGTLEAALGQVVEHVKARKQFGQPLAEFQAVRFAIADANVAVRGLDELAKFTSWRLFAAPPERATADAIALRLHAVDSAVRVMRTCHQMLGAVGFCDEHDVSVFDRHVQPLLRLPVSAERLALRLVPAVRSGEFETLFSEERSA